MKAFCLFFSFLIFVQFCFSLKDDQYRFNKTDWGGVENAFGKVTSSVEQATNFWEPALDALKLGGDILGPVGSVVSFAKLLIGLTQDGPEKAILERLEQLEKAIIAAFKQLGEKMDLGFNEILHHIDRTDYRQRVVDEIRPLWEKLLILTNHPNSTDALNKFVRACADHKPEETLGNMMERIFIEPSILTSLKKVSVYEWKAFESFSSSALQQMTQLQIVFGYCELIANNLTSINESTSKGMFEEKLKIISTAIENSEVQLKNDFLQDGAKFVVNQCIDQYGVYGENGPFCIVQTMKARYPWTNFNLCKEQIGAACHADCPTKAKVDYHDTDHKYIISDLNRIKGCPTGLCPGPNAGWIKSVCSWSGNNSVAATETYLQYSNEFQEPQRKSYPLSFRSKTYKSKSKRHRKRPNIRIEISYSDMRDGESFVASVYTKKNYNNFSKFILHF